MNKNSLITVVLVTLLAVAWIGQISSISSDNKEYMEKLESAEAYKQEGLYQKSFMAYEEALAMKEKQETRDLWLDSYRLAYDDDVVTAKKYGAAIETACGLYPENTAYWERLLSFYLEANNYTAAYEGYIQSTYAGVSSDYLVKLSNQVLYSFTVSRKTYSEYHRSPDGYYSVRDDKGWGVVDPSGERTVECEYLYISPFNLDGMALFTSEKGNRLVSSDQIVEAIIAEEIVQTGAYSDGLLPVCLKGSGWRYIDCATGEYVFDVYDYASNFVDGIAAVCENGKWNLIDTSNNVVSSAAFDDVKLHGNGDYAYKGIMVASQNGQYGLYDAKGEKLCEFSCADADVYLGSAVAYQDASGKWGFVNKEGKVVIEPSYSGAYSFSNGLAAVYNGTAWGYVDGTGAVVIDYQFLTADYFSKNGSTLVSTYEGLFYVLKRRFV